MLLKHGADIDAQNKNGLTLFVLALEYEISEIIDILVQHGADSGAHYHVD
jgi:ankyrin repeat protein